MNPLWLNGEITQAAAARIDPADRGLTLGDGVFETLLYRQRMVVNIDRHLGRLRQGAARLGISIPYDDDSLAAALQIIATRSDHAEAALRLTVTRGPAPRGVAPPAQPCPTVIITAGPLPPALAPARVITATCTRRNEHSPLCSIKSLNYLDSILARQEAEAAGADDALMLNTAGNLAEATAANVFLVIDGTCVTPPVADGALPGIARQLILDSGTAVEQTISRADLVRAESGTIVTSLATRLIAAIDGRPLRV